jgi:hypothetical protein
MGTVSLRRGVSVPVKYGSNPEFAAATGIYRHPAGTIGAREMGEMGKMGKMREKIPNQP